MLLTVTPNPCIERTVMIENFETGQVHRVAPAQLHVNAGGKGINAARVASQLDTKVLCTGWVGQKQIGWFEAELVHENLRGDWVEVNNDTRVCLNILDGRGGKTEVVEAGSPLSVDDGTRLLQKFEQLVPDADLVVIAGSYPTGEKMFDAHATLLIRIAIRFNKKVIYDGKGAAFSTAVRSATPPWCITPNLDEVQELLGRRIATESEERRAIAELLRRGVEVVLLTCGARGAWLGTRQSTVFVEAPHVQEVSAVGSGDSFVGAFAATYLKTADLEESVSYGVAAGAANAAQALSAQCTRTEIEALLPHTQLRRVQQMLPML
jgi:1-phosphofructokinase family hexose kinase